MTSLIPLAQYRMYEDHMDNGWHWLMAVVVFVMLVLVIGLVVWLVRSASTHRAHAAHAGPAPGAATAAATETPLQILDRRLAEGDITPEDYQARSALLR